MTGSSVANIAHIPLSVSQKVKEELAQYAFTTPSIASVAAAASDKLEQHDVVMKEFQERAKMIEADVLLSPTGKAKQMEALAKEFFGKLRFISEAAENRRQAAAQLRAQLDKLPPSGSGDKVVEYLTGQEIRAELRKLTQPERMKLLTDSMQSKNLSLLRAIEASPFGPSELVPDDYRERLREQLVETNQAAEHARWKALVFVGEKLQLLANVLEATLGQYRIDPPIFPAKTDTRAVDLKSVNQQAPPDKSKAVDKQPTTTPAFQ